MLDRARRTFDAGQPAPGGSTLATQIEKYRHSPQGRTDSLSDKLRQMASASLRAYLDGEDTLLRRRQIVVDYLNTVPLAAQAGSGEVNGLGDAMWAWYGRDFDEINRLLSRAGDEAQWLPVSLPRRTVLAWAPATLQQQAVAFKQALSLLVAQRRPSHYLVAGQADLAALTDSHLRLMADAGVISAALRDAALPVRLRLLPHSPIEMSAPFAWRKATATTRSRLSALLGVPNAYDLDRLDLSVVSSVDGRVQRDVTRKLRELKQRAGAKAAGLYAFRLLGEGDEPAPLSFSVSLYERGERANLLRVQADSGDQPFDINEGARLDMGSTAKLRTLISYLEIVTELHAQWSVLDAEALAAVAVPEQDALGRWVHRHLSLSDDRTLGGHSGGRHGAAPVRKPRRGISHRRRRAPLRQLQPRRRCAHAERARGAERFGEPGVHPADARCRAPPHACRVCRGQPGAARTAGAVCRCGGAGVHHPLLQSASRAPATAVVRRRGPAGGQASAAAVAA